MSHFAKVQKRLSSEADLRSYELRQSEGEPYSAKPVRPVREGESHLPEERSAYLPAAEAAKKYALSKDHVTRLCRQGRVEATRLGTNWLVSEASLVEYLNRGKQKQEEKREELAVDRRQEYARWIALREEAAPVGDIKKADPKEVRRRREQRRAHLVAASALLLALSVGTVHAHPNLPRDLAQAADAFLFDAVRATRSLALDAERSAAAVRSAFFSAVPELPNFAPLLTKIGIIDSPESGVADRSDAPSSGGVATHTPTAATSSLATSGAGTGAQSSSAQSSGGSQSAAPAAVRIVERIVERPVIQTISGGVTSAELASKLQQLENSLKSEIYRIGENASTGIRNNFNTIAITQDIDKLDWVTIRDSQFIDGTISGNSSFTGTSITAESGTFSGSVTVGGTLTVSGTGISGIQDDFQINGDVFVVDAETDNVGIGTTSPYAKLSVVGEVVGSYFTATSTAATSTFAGGFTVGSTAFLVDPDGAVVGIGTSTPASTLAVSGSGYFTSGLGIGTVTTTPGSLQATGNAAFGGTLTVSGATGTTTIAAGQGFTIGSSQFVVEQGSGNVGIGTTSPQWTLGVAGSGSFDSFLRSSYFTATSSTTSTFPYASSTALSVSGTADFGTATTTNLNALTATLTNLTVSNAAATSTFAGGLAVNTSGLVYDWQTGRVGIGTTSPAATFAVSGSGYVTAGLGVGIATTTSGVLETSSNAYIGGNLTVVGNSTVLGNSTTVGGSTADTLTINSSINSNLVPDLNATRDLGSPSFYWDDVYVDNLVANNISAASTTIAGTASETFTLNSNNATSDTEDIDLIFYRGLVVPNALISWDSTLDRFDFNQPLFLQNDSSSTTIVSLDIWGKGGQTADLLRVASSSGSSFLSVTSSGRVGVGTSSPAVAFDIYATDALRVPVGTTGQRPATGDTGFIRYNTTTAQFEGYGSSGAWQGLGGVIDIDQDTYIAAEESADEDFLRLYTAGTQRVTITNTGLVGIGTTSPYTALAVAGSSGVLANVFTATSTTATSTFAGGLAIETSGFVYDYSTNNIGIGTASPTSALTFGSDASIEFKGTGLQRINASDASASLALRVAGTDRLTIANGGNVGIGTTSPSNKLVVDDGVVFINNNTSESSARSYGLGVSYAGSAWVPNVDPSDSGRAATFYSATANQASILTLRTVGSPFWDIVSTASSTLNNALAFTAYNGGSYNTRLVITEPGNVGIGTTSPYAKLSVVGQVVAPYYTATSTTATSTFAGGLAVNTSGFVYDYQTGRVGIGTADSGSELEIGGSSSPTFRINPSDNSGAAIQLERYNSSGNYFNIESGAGNRSTLELYYTGTTGLAIDTSGNVGIGTTSPATKLTVANSDTSATQLSFQQSGTGYGGSDGFHIGLSSGATPNAVIVNYENTNLDFYTNGTQYMRLSSDGNLGIGTTSPYAKLSVVGQVVGSYFTATSTTATSTLSTGGFAIGTNQFVVQQNSGRIGVGTQTPGYDFVLRKDSASASTTLVIQNNGGGGATLAFGATGEDPFTRGAYITSVTGNTNSNLIFATGAGTIPTERLRIDPSGSIGISTSSPGSLLSIGGIANFTTATSTFYGTGGGINITSGCYALNGTCIGGSDTWTTSGNNIYYNTGNVGIGTTSPYAKLSVVGQVVAPYYTATSTTATSTFAGGLAVATSGLVYDRSTGFVGVGTAEPATRFTAFDSANAQLRLAQSASVYSTLQVAPTTGDLTVSLATGQDVFLLQSAGSAGANLWVCEGAACPSLTVSTGGNIVVENKQYFGNGFYLEDVSATELGLYNDTGTAIIIFDEGT